MAWENKHQIHLDLVNSIVSYCIDITRGYNEKADVERNAQSIPLIVNYHHHIEEIKWTHGILIFQQLQ
uniref:Uncharacterized protein n=1 Tax=Rhizophora mucronata TaxID=61149 RepID=A0A2P2PKM8_RHIMU